MDNHNGKKLILAETNHSLISLSDVIQVIKFIISTINATCVKEILMPASQKTCFFELETVLIRLNIVEYFSS